MRTISIGILCCLISFGAFAQTPELKGFVYKRELSFGIRVPTQGWAIFANIGRFITVNQSRLIQIELGELKNPKEYKEVGQVVGLGPGWPTPKPYFFGKQNSFYTLRFAYGKRELLAEGAEKSPVELRLIYLGGLSLGILKPYYLYMSRVSDSGPVLVTERYTADNRSAFLDAVNIYGAGGFSKGLDKMKVLPGIHTKIGLSFD